MPQLHKLANCSDLKYYLRVARALGFSYRCCPSAESFVITSRSTLQPYELGKEPLFWLNTLFMYHAKERCYNEAIGSIPVEG